MHPIKTIPQSRYLKCHSRGRKSYELEITLKETYKKSTIANKGNALRQFIRVL